MATRRSFPSIVASLRERYGKPRLPPARGPFELVLFEEVAYLVEDDVRERTFAELKKSIGLAPDAILKAPLESLSAITRAGGSIAFEERAERLKHSARRVIDEWAGDLSAALKLPLPKAAKALAKFDAIGAPGAERILLLCRAHPVLALDSNGLRVLQRIGYGPGEDSGVSYAAAYRGVREALALQIRKDTEPDFDLLIDAHLLLRRHGKETCKRTEPKCSACAVRRSCDHAID